jgi:hypothetical protein
MIHFETFTLIRIHRDDVEQPIQDALCTRLVYGKVNDDKECIYKAGVFQELLDEVEDKIEPFNDKARDQLLFIAAAAAEAEFVLIK